MDDGRREANDFGLGSPNGESPRRFIDAQAPEGDSAKGSQKKVGYVYFLETEDGKHIKIGYSAVMVNRMAQLGTLMPLRLIGCFPGTVHTESWLHAKFAEDHHTGEWFRASSRIRLFIDAVGLMPPVKVLREKDATAVSLGRRGGTARAEKLSAKRRREIAREAAIARWHGKAK